MHYPSGVKTTSNKTILYANRGMTLEQDINETNKYYLIHDIAVVHKKPTPIVVKKVEFKSRNNAIIKDAIFKTPSTTDYNGIYKGKYIDFEAKETKSKTSFPISNFHIHQINHLRSIIKHGGIAFIIVRFTSLNKTFYLDGNIFIDYVDNSNKKSIPYSFFTENGFLILDKYNQRVDYIKIIDNLYFKEVKYER